MPTDGVSGVVWKTYNNDDLGLTLQYPQWDRYISLQVKAVKSSSSAIDQKGCTVMEYPSTGYPIHSIIGGRSYCINREADAAAGSAYFGYHFTTRINTDYITVSYTLRIPGSCKTYTSETQQDCDNYLKANSETVSGKGLLLQSIEGMKIETEIKVVSLSKYTQFGIGTKYDDVRVDLIHQGWIPVIPEQYSHNNAIPTSEPVDSVFPEIARCKSVPDATFCDAEFVKGVMRGVIRLSKSAGFLMVPEPDAPWIMSNY